MTRIRDLIKDNTRKFALKQADEFSNTRHKLYSDLSDVVSNIDNAKEGLEQKLQDVNLQISKLECDELSFKNTMKKVFLSKNYDNSYVVEKKLIGDLFFVHKSDDRARVYLSDKTDVTSTVPRLIKEFSKIKGSFVLACQFGDKPNRIFVYDCLYSNNKSYSQKPWYRRRIELRSLLKSYTGDILKESTTIIVSNETELKIAITMCSKLKNSQGAIIKTYVGTYVPCTSESTLIVVMGDKYKT